MSKRRIGLTKGHEDLLYFFFFFFLALPLESVNYFWNNICAWCEEVVQLHSVACGWAVVPYHCWRMLPPPWPALHISSADRLCPPLSSSVPHCWWPCHLRDFLPAWCLQVLKFLFGFCQDCSDGVGLLDFYIIWGSGSISSEASNCNASSQYEVHLKDHRRVGNAKSPIREHDRTLHSVTISFTVGFFIFFIFGL